MFSVYRNQQPRVRTVASSVCEEARGVGSAGGSVRVCSVHNRRVLTRWCLQWPCDEHL